VETGLIRAALFDNGYLSTFRAATVGAIAAKHLAPPDAHTVGVIGSGPPVETHIRALKQVRDFSALEIWGRDSGRAEALALKIRKALGISVRVARTAEDVVQHADMLITATSASKPLIKRDWLHKGLHITAVGADAADRNELDPRILAEADRVVCDNNERCREFGELRTALATGAVPADFVGDELGDIIAGRKPGRQSDDDITVCDLTGTSAQDAAIADYAFRIAVECEIGLEVEN